MIPQNVSNKIIRYQPFYEEKLIDNLFSWKELESLLNLRPFVNSDRFHIIGEKEYSWKSQDWLSDINTYPPEIIQSEVKKYVCYLNDCSRVNRKVNNLCQILETITECSTDAHIYFSLEDIPSSGFGIHFDCSHNFIVQVEGQTHFKVWGEVENKLKRNYTSEEIDEVPLIDVVMKPGDAIFIPSFYLHSAHSITKRLSISFPMWLETNNPQSRHWIFVEDNK